MTDNYSACPLCRGSIVQGHNLIVCSHCHGGLVASGELPLTSTSEFDAMSPAEAEEVLSRDGSGSGRTSAQLEHTCTWCGKGGGEVKKLLSNRTAHICNECVALCAEILTVELGRDWR